MMVQLSLLFVQYQKTKTKKQSFSLRTNLKVSIKTGIHKVLECIMSSLDSIYLLLFDLHIWCTHDVHQHGGRIQSSVLLKLTFKLKKISALKFVNLFCLTYSIVYYFSFVSNRPNLAINKTFSGQKYLLDQQSRSKVLGHLTYFKQISP